jgi:DnaJ-class molecular chaperone
MSEDLYSILGVKKDASASEIKQAYRKLARKHHPDLNPGDKDAEQRFKKISASYAVLSDPEKRRKYDTLGPRFADGGFAQGADFNGTKFDNFDFSSFGREGGFGDIFEEMFGNRSQFGRRGRQPNGPRRGSDLQYIMNITFEDSIGGLKTQISLNRGGNSEKIRVRIPAGVSDGSKIRLAGKGEPGGNGGAPGDLLIITRVAAHRFFERRGDNIYCVLPITLEEALLGARVEVPTVDGSTTFKVPPGTQSGQKFKLAGKGAPSLRGSIRGHQYVEVRIVLPSISDERSKELIHEFSRLNPQEGIRDDLP